eukprot:Rhum_TRINITY_DN9464_c0_g2::Rhum_TRINITY_DN9464_c0_g2_i1::g.33277::m.33277
MLRFSPQLFAAGAKKKAKKSSLRRLLDRGQRQKRTTPLSEAEAFTRLGVPPDTSNPYSLFLVECARWHCGDLDARFHEATRGRWAGHVERRTVLTDAALEKLSFWGQLRRDMDACGPDHLDVLAATSRDDDDADKKK